MKQRTHSHLKKALEISHLRDGEKRREEKLRGRKRVVSENKAATAQKGKALRHGKGFRGR